MDNIISKLIVGIIILALNVLSRKYIEPTMPDKKKAISYIKKYLSFSFKYVLYVFAIIYSFIFLEFNKLFILINCVCFCGIIFNITMDIITSNFDYYKTELTKKADKKN
ncbi:hypothetical protein [Siansivirga zeaxanthinifaciens]|uniref:Uncharacterized protein n=1 Tax=Siansivirga zeaxanthinifaciens CC-SAMT-1 TaxID=1454006 RepID=A0A0C5WPJ2_9FLAO|nr:hypothetical protein [Siansivirga zeaxanthinifaciens]AJR04830.1 hypothetical protein AW14_06740 [Siansivirga zeaxanthinifaciens CC-SAMT-1]